MKVVKLGVIIPDYLVEANGITKVILRGKQEDQSQNKKKQGRKQRSERRCYDAGFEDEGSSHESMMQAAPRSWRRRGDRFSPRAFKRSMGSLTP